MLSSLRARLLLWYTFILAAVIATFVGIVCYLFWRSLDCRHRPGAAVERDGARRWLAIRRDSGDFDLVLPIEYRQTDAAASPLTYYAVWNGSGELIDRSAGRLSTFPVRRARVQPRATGEGNYPWPAAGARWC